MHRQSSINHSVFNDTEAKSLRRSFSSIHQYHHSSHRTSPTSPLDNDVGMNHCNNRKKKESLRRKSHHNGSGPSRRISMDTTSGDEKQLSSSLPYTNNNTNNNKAERHTRHSHPTSNNNKTKPHNRRASYNGITAQTAQEMVAEMLNDKNTTSSSNNAHHQQHSSSRGHTTTATRQQQQKAPPRRVTVSFGPTKEQLQEQLRNSTQTQYDQQLNYNNSMPDIHNNNNHPQSSHPTNHPQRQHIGYRPDYKLGQVARSPSHLLLPPSPTNNNNNNKSKLNYINQIATLLKHDFAFVKRSNGLYSYAILAYRTNPSSSKGGKSTHNGGNVNNNSNDYYNGEYKEEGMAFVMDDVGSTKMIRKKHWFEYIRLVSMDDLSCNEEDGDSGMGIEEGDYGMDEGLNHTTSHPDVNLSYHQFKSRTTARQGDPQDDPQDNVPQDMLCQEIPQVCQEVNPQVYQEQGEEEMFEFDEDELELPDMISFDPTSGENEDCSLISSVSDRARRANSRVWR